MEDLTAREREVLQLIADGHTQSAIARQLGVSDRVIGRTVHSLYAKLGATTAAHAVAIAAGGLPLDTGSWAEMVRQWRAVGYQVALVPIPGAKPAGPPHGRSASVTEVTT